MSLLIGSTGYVGGHLVRSRHFEEFANSKNIRSYAGWNCDLLVCAGLPAEKWRANLDPIADWNNVRVLADVLRTMTCNRAVLISTIDVYQNPVDVDEDDKADLDGAGAYGINRAWFESFFRTNFPNSNVIRLPGLFSSDLKKNLVFDLMRGRKDQFMKVNENSTFQFIDVADVWSYCSLAIEANIPLLNVVSEPVSAQQIASCFEQNLLAGNEKVIYDVRSRYAEPLGFGASYMVPARDVLEGIARLAK